MRYALALLAVMLLAAGAFLGWSAIVVGARAFEEHADSVPGVYLTAGAIYGLLSISSLIAAYYAGTRAWAYITERGAP